MVFAANNLRKLKNRKLNLFSLNLFYGVNITSLKTLSIVSPYHAFWNQRDRLAMSNGLPNIEYLSVNSYRYELTNSHLIFRATSAGWNNLQQIKLRGLRVGEEFKELLIKSKELKTVEIDKQTFDKTNPKRKEAILSVSMSKDLKFIIYNTAQEEQHNYFS